MNDTQEKTDTEDVIAPAADTGGVLAEIPDPGSLVIDPDQTWWTEGQLAALRQMGVARAPRGDLLVFHHYAKVTGLDPFLRQLYLIPREQNERQPDGSWRKVEKWTIQTGIDGFRLIARRAVTAAGETLEYEDTLYCSDNGEWTDAWLHTTAPMAAKVVVLRNGLRFPAVALYREYAQTKRDGTPTGMWSNMPANQLAKCAEALALRKAFPQDLGGLYTDDEMAQADRAHEDSAGARRAAPHGSVREAMRRRQEAEVPVAPPVPPKTAPVEDDAVDGDVMLDPRGALAQSMHKAFREADIGDKDDRLAFASSVIGRTITGSGDMTEAEVPLVLAAIAQLAAGEAPAESGPDLPVDPEQEHADIIAAELAREEKTDG